MRAQDNCSNGLSRARASVKEVEYHEMRCRSYLNIALVYDQKDDVNEGCRYYSMAIQIAT